MAMLNCYKKYTEGNLRGTSKTTGPKAIPTDALDTNGDGVPDGESLDTDGDGVKETMTKTRDTNGLDPPRPSSDGHF